jgi:hypothetical protein
MAGKKTDRPMLAGGLGVASWARIILTFVILLSFLLVAGCSSQPSEISANVGEEFSIAVGQSASIAGEELKIKFIEVVADSRCPTGATCVWQGEVTCLVEISYFESLHRKALTQPGLTGEPSQAEFKDYEITFNVEPYPVVGKEIENTDYRLQLTVDKKSALSGGVLVTFDVVGERYSIFITNNNTIEQVFALQRGEGEAAIPSGRLVRGSVFYNEPWSWHIDSDDIQMAEVIIELCDGTPSQVEDNLDYWLQSIQRFCPWSARIVEIQDFRVE